MLLIEFIDALDDEVMIATQRERFTRNDYRRLITADPEAGGWAIRFRVEHGLLAFYRCSPTARGKDLWLGMVSWPDLEPTDDQTILAMAALHGATDRVPAASYRQWDQRVKEYRQNEIPPS